MVLAHVVSFKMAVIRLLSFEVVAIQLVFVHDYTTPIALTEMTAIRWGHLPVV